ncbi:MAG: UvrD-helicase domain-containing protein [Bacteroidales bacterium]|nr:UvrD-helicase domain-containing protein [Candidatus Cacconaster merdequi]
MSNCQTDLYEGLNCAQKEAVACTEGPSLIIAGAGSGKTRVLTCRVAHILSQGCRPSEVMALTFTKKAAGEMKERIASLVGDYKARWICMGTFHSVFIRFLREWAEKLGYPQQFTIYDQSDSRSIVKQCIKELELDDKTYKPNAVQSRISLAKNNLVTVTGYRNNVDLMESDRASRHPRICDVYELYQKKCKGAGAMDFDDILLNMNILLRDFPEVCEKIASRFKYIMVDEYQDTNHAQYIILRKLAARHHNICVVGDDSQSIYGFRGARIENILRFQKDYPDAKVFRLEQNYRSTRTIVNAANSLISKNENRLEKECYSMAEEGEKIQVIKAFTENEEAFLIASSIVDRIFSDKVQYDSFAILYRTNAQSRALEESLRRKNLPFRIYGGHSFYDRAEVKDMLAYFKLIVNNLDDESFRRVVNVPARGIGETSLERLAAAASASQRSLFEATYLPVEDLYAQGLKDAAITKFRSFSKIIEQLSQKAPISDCYELAVEAGNLSGYLASLNADNSPEGTARFENIEELFNSIKEYSEQESEMRKTLADDGEEAVESTVTLSDYLENIYLMSEVEKDDEQDPDLENSNRITLMTVHASKGLEFPYVYIAGMEENLFPSESMNDSLEKIEEERRLFYVALTRAMKAITLSFAQNRRKWGSEESNRPSRFLREIDRKWLSAPISSDENHYDDMPRTSFQKSYFTTQRNSGGYVHKSEGRMSQAPSRPSTNPAAVRPRPSAGHTPSLDFVPSAISELRIGSRVEHDRFGFGQIMSFDGTGANMKAVVRFDDSGEKTLLLKFARLRVCN